MSRKVSFENKLIMKTNQSQNNISDGVMKTILMNHLTGRNKTSKGCYLDMYLTSLNEAGKLLEEAKLLLKNNSHERAYFLGFSALEEISKSQLSADVYTGFITEGEFKKVYRDHKEKISRVKWIQLDGNLFPFFSGDGIKINDFDFRKKLRSMYVDIDSKSEIISSPSEAITKADAESIIKAINVGLYRIYQVTKENGEQIGTKGFMK
jgi:AbiV family abortive infection protein